ncbi:hypothetical protein ACLKA7_001717 [Drosophila subpalustris]
MILPLSSKIGKRLPKEGFAKEDLDIAFLQEPWILSGKIKGLNTRDGNLIYAYEQQRPRAALLLNKKMTFVPLSQFITEDLVAVWAKVPTASGEQEAVLASAYFPGDSSDAPPREVSALVEYCQDKRIRWIIGCDANAHHTVWGSTDVNKREKEACLGALRLQGVANLKSGDLTGHLKILEIFFSSPIVHLSDVQLPRMVFNRNFTVAITDRNSWRNQNLCTPSGAQVWYTDGSKLENGDTGAGVWGPRFCYLTGHCGLRYHLKNLNLSDTETCRFCALEQETSEHVLCECPALCRRKEDPLKWLSIATIEKSLSLKEYTLIAFLDIEGAFNNVFPREDWSLEPPGHPDALSFYTDGSKLNNKVGGGVHSPILGIDHSFRLPDHCSVFQAEMLAINESLKLLQRSNTAYGRINIYSDSQAAIKSIAATTTKSTSVSNCRRSLHEMAELFDICLIWVPEHKDIPGNCIADKLARRGTTDILLPDKERNTLSVGKIHLLAGWHVSPGLE